MSFLPSWSWVKFCWSVASSHVISISLWAHGCKGVCAHVYDCSSLTIFISNIIMYSSQDKKKIVQLVGLICKILYKCEVLPRYTQLNVL